MTDRLAPPGLHLRLDDGLRRTGNGRLLIGGAPLHIVRLSVRGAAVVDGWSSGRPITEAESERRLARRLLVNGMVHPVVDPAAAIDVTVVVPIRDDTDGLARCLAGLGDNPVVVVDDGSADPAAVVRVADRHGARVIRRAASGGPGVARDEGLAVVASPLVAFVDADVVAGAEWVERLAGHFSDPAVAAVAPRVRTRPGPSLLERYEHEHSPLDLGPMPARVGPGRPVSYVPTAAFVARTETVRGIGGFDAGLRRGEDVDLVWRLVDAGHDVRYDPSVEVSSVPRPDWRAWFRQRRGYGATAAPLGARHPDKIAPARCSRWSAAAWGAAAARHPVIGVGIAAGSTAALVRKLEGLPDPGREAARLAVPGHFWAGVGLARAVTRVWWPIAVLVAVLRPRLRPTVAAAFVGPALLDWCGGRRPADPIRSVGLRVADDMAYGTGVWSGMRRHRTLVPLAPELSEWPGSAPAVEQDTVADR